MDLWKEFEMGDRITGMWRELGISAGTAVAVLIAFYFVIKWAVKKGITEAYKEMERKNENAQDAFKADKPASGAGLNGNEAESCAGTERCIDTERYNESG